MGRRRRVARILSPLAVCTDLGGKLSHVFVVHDLQSDAGIAVVQLATWSCIHVLTAPVHDQDPAAAEKKKKNESIILYTNS